MARVAALDRPVVVRSLGLVMAVLMVGTVFATYAVFTRMFSRDVPVVIRSNGVGMQLNTNADVKLRGVIVGRVDDIRSEGGQAVIELAIDQQQRPLIPSNVEAYIVPKTLFGEKFIDLQPPAQATDTSIRAGDEIVQAALPTEIENVLRDLDPLLQALNPVDLSRVLTALSQSLNGEGENAGQTIEALSTYLTKVTPLADEIVEDVTLLGDTAQTYADVMPEIGATLRNAVVTGNTLTSRKAQLQTLFVQTAAFATAAESFLDETGDDFIALTDESQPTLNLLARYSPTANCVIRALGDLKPRVDSVFRDQRAHVMIEYNPRTARAYGAGDSLSNVAPGSSGDRPRCGSLPNPNYSASRPAPGLSDSLLRQLGVDGDLGKTAPLSGASSAVVTPAGSEAEGDQIDAIVGGAIGVAPDDVPDVAQALFGPALRGAEVTLG